MLGLASVRDDLKKEKASLKYRQGVGAGALTYTRARAWSASAQLRNLFQRSHEHSEPALGIIYGYGSVPFISSVVL